MVSRYLLVLLGFFFFRNAHSATITITGSGNWSSTTPNAPWPGGVLPAAGDDVVVASGFTLTVDGNYSCNSINIGTAANTSNTLLINSGFTLTVANAVTIVPPNAGTNNNTLNVGDGALVCNALNSSNSGNNLRDCIISIGNGSITVNGNITLGANTLRNSLSISGTGAINVSGTFTGGGTISIGSGTVHYSGAAQTLHSSIASYGSLTLSGSGNKTMAVNTTVTRHLSSSGTAVLDATASNFTLSVGGNLLFNSTAADPFLENSGSITLNGTGLQLVDCNSGSLNLSAFVVNNTSGLSTGVQVGCDLVVNRFITFTAGNMDLQGNDLTSNGSSGTTTDTYTSGSVFSSLAGTDIVVTDADTSKSIQYDGTNFGDASVNLNFSVIAANIYFDGSDFYGPATFTKIGLANNDTDGGCLFTGPVTFNTVVGGERWRMANLNPDVFYNATFNHDGNSNFILARQTLGNEFFGTTTINSSTSGGFFVGRNNTLANGGAVFHGPVIINVTLSGNVNFAESNSTISNDVVFESTIQLNSSASSTGDIRFGSTGFGSTTLSNTAAFVPGTILGATTVTLLRLTQNGTLPQEISASGICLITAGTLTSGDGCVFNGPVTFTADRVSIRNSTFNNTADFTQYGSISNTTFGGNTFNGDVSFIHNGTTTWSQGASAGDDFNAHVIFERNNTGRLLPANLFPSTFAGNITLQGSGIVEFSDATGGEVLLDGTSQQVISGTAGLEPTFGIIEIDNSSGALLGVGIIAEREINFIDGIIECAGNRIVLNNNATSVGASNASYVDGQFRKIGNQAFTFPVGDAGFYAPISISAPGNSTHHFTAQYFGIDPDSPGFTTTSKEATLDHLSQCEYWILDRSGTSNVTVTLSWDTRSCGVNSVNDLRVARWDGSVWRDHGNGGTTVAGASGTVVSSAAVTSFSPFTLASVNTLNPLPVELLAFDAIVCEKEVCLSWSTASEQNASHFLVEVSTDGVEYRLVDSVIAVGNSSVQQAYASKDFSPSPGLNYYRLVQVDRNGEATTYGPIGLDFSSDARWNVFPNPTSDGAVQLSGVSPGSLIQVTDLSGRLVYSFTWNNTSMALPLHGGIYLVHVVDSKGKSTRRLVVQ
jgi:hypothetical protein